MEVYSSDSDVALDRAVFYLGAKWCGPCKKALPLYKTFADDYAEDFEVTFYYIDIDTFSSDNETLEKEVKKVTSIPTLLCFLNNSLVETISPWSQEKLYTAMHIHYVDGEPVDNSRFAVIPDRVPNQPDVSSSSSDDDKGKDPESEPDFDFDIPACEMGECFDGVIELVDHSKINIGESSGSVVADSVKEEPLEQTVEKLEIS
jgi:hypothetical protein